MKTRIIILLFSFLFLASTAQTTVQTYTVAGNYTFTVPSGVYYLKVECWGGGGGGGSSTYYSGMRNAGGGGGGAYSKVDSLTVIPLTTYSLIVGKGGLGSIITLSGLGWDSVSIASSGENTSFNSADVVAAGGEFGGNGIHNLAHGLGGNGGSIVNSIGTIIYSGGNGANGIRDSINNWGGGGGGSAGTSSNGNNAGIPTNVYGGVAVTGGGEGGFGGAGSGNDSHPGHIGYLPGGGGGGGRARYSNTGPGGNSYSGIGGDGADGQIIISYTLPIGYPYYLSVCDSVMFNNQTITQSGIYIDTLMNFQGTDSIVELHLTITNSTSDTINQTACNSYSLNSQTYTTSGTYTQTLTNANGCDSLLTLNLTINTINDSVTLGNASFFASSATGNYQWLDCDNAYAIISGETNQIYTPGTNGNFAVMITDKGCIDTSACLSMFSVGINAYGDWREEVRVYPNPATSELIIHTTNASTGSAYLQHQPTTIKIYNVLGETVYSSTIKQFNTTTIDIEGFTRGIYFIEVVTDASAGSASYGVVRQKFIKQGK